MNAQEAWKHLYQGWKRSPIYTLGGNYPKYCERGAMKDIRREAALERQVAALQRQNAAQEQQIAELESNINELMAPRDDFPPEYSDMELLQREAAGA